MHYPLKDYLYKGEKYQTLKYIYKKPKPLVLSKDCAITRKPNEFNLRIDPCSQNILNFFINGEKVHWIQVSGKSST